jgi:conjugal transfer pilus assembly protein TraK
VSKLLAIATLFLLFIVPLVQAESVVTAEVPTIVELSNRDINRIVCPGQMNDLIFSKEKGLIGHFSGNNAFIKFQIEQNGDEYIYADTPSELFAVCNGAVYTLIVSPMDVPSVTVRLGAPKGDTFKKNIVHYKNLPLEKQALQIIREAYNETYPSSYRITESSKLVSLSPELQATLLQNVDVDGVGLRLKKYQVQSTAANAIDLDEKLFLTPSISTSILAVAVEDHNLLPGEMIRAFIVEKKEQGR